MNEKPFSLMQVGSVTVPVTDYATVYIAMKNFLNVASQLKQQTLPLFMKESWTVVHIYLNHNEVFQHLLRMLGAFHMAKTPKHSARKYIRDRGFWWCTYRKQNIWNQSVFDGTHYIRPLWGLLITSEAINSFQWQVFRAN